MKSDRFDLWTRDRALRLSRRDALRLAGVSAAGLPILGAHALAQTACALTIHAEIVAGPSAPIVYDGQLQFTLSANGSLAQAFFTLTNGGAQPATGRMTGRAIDIQITLPGNRLLTLSGVADQPISTCQVAAIGILSGPQPGDLGAWQATTGGTTTAPVTTSAQTTANANPIPPPAGSNCSAPSFACGPNCCPSGAACTDANQGICICPGGTTQCGLSCVPNCPDGQTLDLDSCTCFSTCTPDQGPCTFDMECCSGACLNGACGACSGLLCGDMGCVDQTSDPNNCGACGNVCVDDTGFCLGGNCQCIPDGEPMGSSSSSCCSNGMAGSSGLCGCANLNEACSSTSQCCDNSTLGALCVDGRAGFHCCLPGNSACSADSDCCFSEPGSIPQSACINGVCAVKP